MFHNPTIFYMSAQQVVSLIYMKHESRIFNESRDFCGHL